MSEEGGWQAAAVMPALTEHALMHTNALCFEGPRSQPPSPPALALAWQRVRVWNCFYTGAMKSRGGEGQVGLEGVTRRVPDERVFLVNFSPLALLSLSGPCGQHNGAGGGEL